MMLEQDKLFSLENRYSEMNPNDVVFTPESIAKMIVDTFKPAGKCLDPCRGNGAFWNYLPIGSDWCEITEGRDFFQYEQKVDWIVSNPPYSNWDAWLNHSFRLAENIVYLVPFAKVFKSWGTMKLIFDYGGIVEVLAMPAGMCGFPFGFPAGAFYFQRGYSGKTDIRMIV